MSREHWRPLRPMRRPALAELVHSCLSKRAENRPTASDLVFHLTHLADGMGARLTVEIAREGLQSMASDTAVGAQ